MVLRAGQYSGALSNGGERIRLRDATTAVVDEVTYLDAGTWPAMADGEGASLQRRDPSSSGSFAGNWVSGEPTPSAPNSDVGAPLPTFSAVLHTVLPAPGSPIAVTAELQGAATAELHYRLGVEPAEVTIEMTVSGGAASASIPGQPAGALVRYRLTASSGSTSGSWPRQGDGSVYTGTTVAVTVGTQLPRLEIFMDDDVYQQAMNDRSLTGDDGYPMVLADEGRIFDNARMRIKGQSARSLPKPKWKVVLPAGHSVVIGDEMADPVDELALHSSYIDKSYAREILTAELFEEIGLRVSQTFPVRVERNGQFHGLYNYVEQPDGTYRERHEIDDSLVYDVGPDELMAGFTLADAASSQSALRARYQPETFEFVDGDAELRALITAVNDVSASNRRDWLRTNVDVAAVVNAIAATVVVQHLDIGPKNLRLVRDVHGRWSVIPVISI